MTRTRTALFAALAALAALTAPVESLRAQDYAAATVRGAPPSRSTARIDEALREFGFRPARLSREQVRAINDAWRDLLGNTGRGGVLSPRQATAIVYLALVHDGERRPRPYPHPAPDRSDRDPRCEEMAGDAYRLGLRITAPENGYGLFVQEPERGRARTLARRIQEQAIQCRAFEVADRAGDVLAALASNLPGRSDLERLVNALKREIEDAATRPGRRR